MKPAPPVTRTGFFNVIPQEKTKCNHVEYTAAYQGRGILGQSYYVALTAAAILRSFCGGRVSAG
jgi:hypothetical protein